MADQKPPKDIADLIFKYLSGNASDIEVRQLEAWVLEDPSHKDQFMAFKKVWMFAAVNEKQKTVDVNKAWKNLTSRLFQSKKVFKLIPKKSSRAFSWIKIAAAVLLLGVAGIGLLNVLGNKPDLTLAAQDNVLEQMLPDGSRVSLNRSSSLSYTFKQKNAFRSVSLKGDAFFEVVRDTSIPFIINADRVEIEVLGTSFYVDAREDQSNLQVIVRSGTVAMRQGNQEIVLTENEVGSLDKNTGMLVEKQNTDVNYLGWTNNTLAFENTPLEEVVFTLNRHFHTQIALENPEIRDCKLTATYRDKKLDAVIRIIESSLGVASRKEGEKIIFSGSGCN